MKNLLILALALGYGFANLHAVTDRMAKRNEKNKTLKVVTARLSAKDIRSSNALDADGNSALHRAVANGHIKEVFLLLKKRDIKINLCNFDGETSLHIAAVTGVIEIVKLLVHAGCALDIRDKEGFLACEKATTYEVEKFLKSVMPDSIAVGELD